VTGAFPREALHNERPVLALAGSHVFQGEHFVVVGRATVDSSARP